MGVYCLVTHFGGGGEWQRIKYGDKTRITCGHKTVCRFTPPLIGEANADNILAVGDYDWLAGSLSSLGKKAKTCETPAKALEALKREMRSGDCVILMSNGDFGDLPAEIAEFVKAG